ncbi:CAF1 family ribonuclease domain-containing protein [Ditylenchus destructor]|uniref:poly(A)-specific ribonuclease n=1 Tax=Ditylenchus destructor TaxID=166010 RepID=A0AAD4NB02_9BILA|nr:CAF1 family ribonuclease domain-containing protein [Ditylenchus destructor]
MGHADSTIVARDVSPTPPTTLTTTTCESGSTEDTEMKVSLHEVWTSNLEEEFEKLRSHIADYPYVAMDTEFPGIVFNPQGDFRNKEQFNYRLIYCNVNMLKVIQVGFTLVNSEGRLPPNNDIWQFNLHFDLQEDAYAADSIELLQIAGIDFAKHKKEGISMAAFGELLTSSGLIVDERINWITFHSCFDFGYLMKCILLVNLPDDENEFFRIHNALFPTGFDIKMMLKQPGPLAANLNGSLQDVANQLQVPRIGEQHQAGSDSLLTAMTFFRLKERFFGDCWDKVFRDVKGRMFGLGS